MVGFNYSPKTMNGLSSHLGVEQTTAVFRKNDFDWKTTIAHKIFHNSSNFDRKQSINNQNMIESEDKTPFPGNLRKINYWYYMDAIYQVG